MHSIILCSFDVGNRKKHNYTDKTVASARSFSGICKSRALTHNVNLLFDWLCLLRASSFNV